MAEYDSSREVALRLITKKGRELKYRTFETDPALSDPNKPWDKNAPLGANKKPKGVVLNYVIKAVNGTTIMQGDKQVFLAAQGLDFEPGEKDMIWDEGRWYKVIAVDNLAPGDQTVLYTLQIRR